MLAKRQISFLVVSSIACCFLSAPTSKAEERTGSLYGKVTDPSGAAVPGANVTATERSTLTDHSTVSATEGYHITGLPPGDYTVTVSSVGFREAKITNVHVPPGPETRQDVVLQVGSVAQTVTITAAAFPSALSTETTSLGVVISEKEIAELPLAEGNIFQLASLQPGSQVISPAGANVSSLSGLVFSLGSRARSNNLSVDGLDSNDPFTNTSSQASLGSGTPINTLPVDAIQEFRVESQFAPEQGSNSGSLINLVTKRGTNTFHGSAFLNLFNDIFNARNFFNPRPNPKSRLRHTEFGFSLGGPLKQDKAWIFGSYEGVRDSSAVSFLSFLLNSEDLTSAINQIGGADHINPLSASILSSVSIAPQRRTYVVIPSSSTFNRLFVRADLQPTTTDTFNVVFGFDDGDELFPLNSRVPGFRTSATPSLLQLGAEYTRLFSSHSSATVRFGYNRFESRLRPADTGPASPLPLIRISGFSPLGLPLSVPSEREPARSIQMNGIWRVASGRHDAGLGVELRLVSVKSSIAGALRGAFLFDSLADFLLGRSTYARILAGDVSRETGIDSIGGYVQDSWRWTKRLTLNWGVRWDLFGVIHERRDLLATFLPNTSGLVQVGHGGVGSPYPSDLNNFGPRIGIAFDPSGHGHVLIRAGYGIFYDAPPADFFLSQVAPNTISPGPAYDPIANGIVAAVSRSNFLWQNNSALFGLSIKPPFDLFVADHRIRTPYIQSYNLTCLASPTERTLLQVSYAGSVGRRLFRILDLNQPSPGPAVSAQTRRPFSQVFSDFAVIDALESAANSNYNSLLTSFDIHRFRGLDFRFTYALSHSIDNASDGTDFDFGVAFPQDSRSLTGERSSSTFDVRHRATINLSFEFPKTEKRSGLVGFLLQGWGLSAISVLQSGHPFDVVTLSNPSGTNEFADRPDLVGNPVPRNRTADNFLNFPAFSDRFSGRFGNLARNALSGPNLLNVDFGIRKESRLSEKKVLRFGAQIFNVLNRTNLALPERLLSDGQAVFGKVTSTVDAADGSLRLGNGGAREIQFEIKFTF